MENDPLFSVIIPVYKVEKYLKECVKSVLLQDDFNFEIILIDDGSPDACPEFCDKFSEADKRIKVIHKKNGGVSAARKDGVDFARGEYIVCIDADDSIEQGLLSAAKKIINDMHPDILYYGTILEQSVLKDDNSIYRAGYYTKDEIEKEIFPILIQADNAQYFAPSVWGKIVKRKLFQDNLICDKQATVGEDGACIIPCIYHAKSLFVMKENYYHYRYNDSSVTKERKAFNWDCTKIINEHIISRINIADLDFEAQMYRKLAHDFFNTALTQFYSDKTYKEIKNDILKHMQEEPYYTAIEKAQFKNSKKAALMMTALKNKWIFLISIYAKVRKK